MMVFVSKHNTILFVSVVIRQHFNGNLAGLKFIRHHHYYSLRPSPHVYGYFLKM